MKETFFMAILILFYVFYFSFICMRIFAGTVEGTAYFGTFPDSFFNMFVLLTTANFPDIMLPTYSEAGYTCFVFIAFLILGLWLLMNLFLAIFYARY